MINSNGGYKNFEVAIYARAYEVEKMGDPDWLKTAWNTISRQVHIDKIYLETHRDLLIVDKDILRKAIDFFEGKGLKVSGGITFTIDESNYFETFSYSDPEHRQKIQEISEYTARFFDEFILDDFFFTNSKSDVEIEAKGDLSWTGYRLEVMKEAATELVINPARETNPDVDIIIKYPNWYEHFQGLGFNLEEGPLLFDGIYTGTETRDRSMRNQHLQQYLGYAVYRYYDNLSGENRGGWVDPFGLNYMDRYAEQLWLTLFARAPEITLFDIRMLVTPLNEYQDLRADWQGEGSLFDFDEMIESVKPGDASLARAAGYSLEIVDRVIDKLGKPIGVKSYKPYHSVGEDFLQTYFGMIGIPIDIVPQFPENEEVVILTETASCDPDIISKIQVHLKQGKNIIVTSGLYSALQGKGIEDIVELRMTNRKASVREFAIGRGDLFYSEKEMSIPQLNYLTNDSWEVISALDDTNGWPLMHFSNYSSGKFYLWVIPDNFIDLYQLPEAVLNQLRSIIAGHLDVLLEAPAEVSLFVYNNNSFVVESFLHEEVSVKIVLDKNIGQVTD
ncbi:MAG: hypothetical protein ACOC2J_03695, partial [bacterium]